MERARPGGRVAGTVWQGEIVALSTSAAAARTSAHPVGDPLFAAGFGMLLVLGGGLSAYAGR